MVSLGYGKFFFFFSPSVPPETPMELLLLPGFGGRLLPPGAVSRCFRMLPS